jgi:diguanylate cyclase (GGDEF)-like protein
MTYGFLLLMYILSAAASWGILMIAIYARNAPKSLCFTYCMLAIFILNIGFLFEITSSTLSTAYIATQVQYFGGPFIAPFALMFILEYCGVKFRAHHVALMLLVPVMACLLVLTWPLNGIYYQSVEFVTDALIPHLVVQGSAFYYVFMAYSLILPVAAVIVLIRHFMYGDRIFRRQALMIIFAISMPSAAIIINISGIGGRYFDATPICLSITCLLMTYVHVKLGLYRVAPIAREQIVEKMSDGFIIVDMQGNFVDANAAAKHILPQLRAASAGVKLAEIKEISWLGNNDADSRNEFSIPEQSGAYKHYRTSETEVVYANKAIGRCVMIYDVTEAKNHLDEMSLLAERDSLTGLFNRRTFDRNGEQLFDKVIGSGEQACMLMIDLDFFKDVNDNYGHIKGDEVLQAIAEVLSLRLRNTDLVARYGGEEFCAFLPNISEYAAADIARELRERIEKLKFPANDSTFQITVSIGLAVLDTKRHVNFKELLADADAALYAAKNAGRNTIYVAKTAYAAPDVPVDEQIVLECALGSVLAGVPLEQSMEQNMQYGVY